MHCPRFIVIRASNAKLLNLLKLMNSEYSQSISTMWTSLFPKAGRITGISGKKWILLTNVNNHAFLHIKASRRYYNLKGSSEGWIQSSKWYAQSGCSAVAIRYLSSPSPVTYYMLTKTVSLYTWRYVAGKEFKWGISSFLWCKTLPHTFLAMKNKPHVARRCTKSLLKDSHLWIFQNL